jgi:hypothetical protein
MRILLLTAALLAGTLQAQTLSENYIELTVSDTLPMPVKAYVYELFVEDETNYDGYDDNTDWDKVQQEILEKRSKAFAKLEKELQGMGFAVRADYGGQGEYSIASNTGFDQPNALHVTAGSQDELLRLVSHLRSKKGISGNLLRTEYDRTASVDKDMMVRLFRKAEERCNALAVLGGRQLGKLLVARSSGEGEFTFTDFMRLMEQQGQGELWNGGRPAQQPYTMTFRFALTDRP